VTARTGVSGKHLPNSPETPPRAMRLDGLIPAYILIKDALRRIRDAARPALHSHAARGNEGISQTLV